MFNYNDYYNQIINTLDITDIISEHVRLRKTGRGYMGLCPFHHEKTASFHVWPDTQSYYCFGCHEGGNIFTFVMKTEGLNFREALELLADRAGIDITVRKDGGGKNLYDVLEISAKFFTNNLVNSHGMLARNYLSRRNLSQHDVNTFSLGYSLNSWDSLANFLRHEGISDRQILTSGLALTNKNGIYDRFRGRLIFPVKDITGKIIAFGGRLIDGDGVKYINSPENEIYSKRKNLYMLNDARKYIREKSRSILVEGYMDALRLHKSGFRESVASLGTSLTPEQAELLSRFADRCYICYDNDAAGQNATIRAMYILAENGLDVRVINIPDGKDPDEFLCANPPEKFESLIAEAKPLVMYHIDYLRPMLENSASRKSALKNLFDGLTKLSTDEILQYRSKLSEVTLIPPSELEQRIKTLGIPERHENIPQIHEQHQENHDDDLEAGLCALLMRSVDCRLSIEPSEVYKILACELAQNTAISILSDNPENLEALWLSIGDEEKIGFIARGEDFCRQIGGDIHEKWQKIYTELRTRGAKHRISQIQAKLAAGNATNTELHELTELQKIVDTIHTDRGA